MSEKRKKGKTIVISICVLAIAYFVYNGLHNRSANQNSSGILHPDWLTYTSITHGFSIKYPKEYTVNSDYIYEENVPGMSIPGVSFAIPTEKYAGTNFVDGYISTEIIRNPSSCKAEGFLDAENKIVGTKTINNMEFSTAEGTGVGAGQYYNETIYATLHGTACFGFRLFLHTGNITMYDPGTVIQFDPKEANTIF